MRVIMNTSESTLINGKAMHCLGGREYDVPDNVGRAWIAKKIAVPATIALPVPEKITPTKVKGEQHGD